MSKTKYEVVYCTHCNVWSIKCPECEMGGCSLVDEEYELSNALALLLGNTNLQSLLDNTYMPEHHYV